MAVVVCTNTFAVGEDVAVRGRRYRSTDPIVVAAPDNFVPHETPESEWKTPFDQAVADDERRGAELQRGRLDQAKNNRVTLNVGSVFRARRDVLDLDNLRTIVKHSTVLAGDPLLDTHADDFEPVKP
jgi:hypothetical protein